MTATEKSDELEQRLAMTACSLLGVAVGCVGVLFLLIALATSQIGDAEFFIKPSVFAFCTIGMIASILAFTGSFSPNAKRKVLRYLALAIILPSVSIIPFTLSPEISLSQFVSSHVFSLTAAAAALTTAGGYLFIRGSTTKFRVD